MADVIMVLNAGSSSIKFSAFDVDGEDLELVTRGQVEGLFSSPHFVAFDAKGEKTGEHQWGDGETPSTPMPSRISALFCAGTARGIV